MRRSKKGNGKGASDSAHPETMRKSIVALPLAHRMRVGGRYHRTGTPVPHGTEDHQPSDLTILTYRIWYLLSLLDCKNPIHRGGGGTQGPRMISCSSYQMPKLYLCRQDMLILFEIGNLALANISMHTLEHKFS